MNNLFYKCGVKLVAVSLLILALCVVGTLRYGSLQAAIGAMRGQSLMIDKAAVDVGSLGPKEFKLIKFNIENISDKYVNIIGVSTSCTCLRTEDKFPLTILPHGAADVGVKVKPSTRLGPVKQGIEFYTDLADQPKLLAEITTRLRP